MTIRSGATNGLKRRTADVEWLEERLLLSGLDGLGGLAGVVAAVETTASSLPLPSLAATVSLAALPLRNITSSVNLVLPTAGAASGQPVASAAASVIDTVSHASTELALPQAVAKLGNPVPELVSTITGTLAPVGTARPIAPVTASSQSSSGAGAIGVSVALGSVTPSVTGGAAGSTSHGETVAVGGAAALVGGQSGVARLTALTATVPTAPALGSVTVSAARSSVAATAETGAPLASSSGIPAGPPSDLLRVGVDRLNSSAANSAGDSPVVEPSGNGSASNTSTPTGVAQVEGPGAFGGAGSAAPVPVAAGLLPANTLGVRASDTATSSQSAAEANLGLEFPSSGNLPVQPASSSESANGGPVAQPLARGLGNSLSDPPEMSPDGLDGQEEAATESELVPAVAVVTQSTGRNPSPQPQGAGLLTRFLPIDRQALRSSIDQLFERWEAEEVDASLASEGARLAPWLLAAIVATTAVQYARRRAAIGAAWEEDDWMFPWQPGFRPLGDEAVG